MIRQACLKVSRPSRLYAQHIAAVSAATDAARAAASIVLTTPGLSVIIDAIKESRRIFQRMNSYAIYRITETLRVLLFMTLSILVFNFYPVTAVMIVMLAQQEQWDDLEAAVRGLQDTNMRMRYFPKPVVIAPEHLGPDFLEAADSGYRPPPMKEDSFSKGVSLKESVENYKRRLILAALDKHNGNLSAAARDLGMHRSNLHNLAKRLGLKS